MSRAPSHPSAPTLERHAGRRPVAWAVAVALLAGCPDAPPAPVTCGEGEVGEPDGTCVPEVCGDKPFGDLEPHPTEATFWVAARAEAPGDGSQEAPFTRLGAALEAAVAVPGGRVLIDSGRYLDHLSFNRAHDGLELIGRCTELVIVDGEGLAGPTLAIFASSVVVRSMTITGGRPGVIAGEVPGAPGLVLRGNDLVIDGNGGYGVLATGTGVLVDLAESTIKNISPTNVVSPARGIGVEQTATLIGQGLLVDGVAGIGVQVLAGSAEVEDSLIQGGLVQADGQYGRGLQVTGGELTLRRTTVGVHPERGAVVDGGGTLRIIDSDLRGGDVQTARVTTGGSMLAERSQVLAPSGLGVQVHGANSFLVLAGSTVEGSASATAGPLVSVEAGAALSADGALLTQGFGRALHVAGAGSVGQLDDTDVLDTRAGEASVDPGVGVLVSDEGDVQGDDLTVAGSDGPGLWVTRSASARCVSCSVRDAVFAGAMVTGGAELRLDGGQLRDVAAHGELQGGVGALGVGGGAGEARLQMDDTLVMDTDHAGIAVSGAGSFRFASTIVETAGQGSLAPGLLATEGTGRWQGPNGPGLFIFDVTFRQLPNDAILMDGATGTISGSTFDGVGQLELYTQNCGGVLPPDAAEELQGNDCAGPPRVLGAPLAWPAAPVAPGL